jgi:hypothetical protein
MQWRLWFPRNTSSTVRRIFFKIFLGISSYDVRQRFFHDWFIVGETPHFSVRLHLAYDLRTATLCNSRVYTISSLVNHPPKRRGYYDTAVRTGTSGTGSVHQYSRYWFSTYMLLVNQSLILRGLFPTLRGLFRAVSHIHVSLPSLIATQLCVAL